MSKPASHLSVSYMRPALRLRPWRAGDETAFEPAPDFAREIEANAWDWSRGPPEGVTWALVRWNGGVVGLGGLIDLGEGRWNAWAQLSILDRRDYLQALWLAERAIGQQEAVRKVVEIRALARVERPGAARCLARLAFEAQGVRAIHAVGADYVVMTRAAPPPGVSPVTPQAW